MRHSVEQVIYDRQTIPRVDGVMQYSKAFHTKINSIINDIKKHMGCTPAALTDAQLLKWKNCGMHSTRFIRALFPYDPREARIACERYQSNG